MGMRTLSKGQQIDLLVVLHRHAFAHRIYGYSIEGLLEAGRDTFIATALASYDALVARGLPLQEECPRPSEADMGEVYDRLVAEVRVH